MKYQYIEDEINLSKNAKEMLAKAKEQEKEKLKKGYVYVTLRNGMKVLTKAKNGRPILSEEELLHKYNLI